MYFYEPYVLSAFTPVLPGMQFSEEQLPVNWELPVTTLPEKKSGLAYYNIPQLAYLIRHKMITSS